MKSQIYCSQCWCVIAKDAPRSIINGRYWCSDCTYRAVKVGELSA